MPLTSEEMNKPERSSQRDTKMHKLTINLLLVQPVIHGHIAYQHMTVQRDNPKSTIHD